MIYNFNKYIFDWIFFPLYSMENIPIVGTFIEIPLDVTFHCLKKAKEENLINILNPAPACKLRNDFFKLVDYFTPNETEAEFYTGVKIDNEQDAKDSAKKLISMGIKKWK